jgi:5-methylcytosine-specific restriction protein B
MQIERLGKLLAADLANAGDRDRAVTIHLFGIRYANDIGNAATQVAIAAGISPKYGTEIRKGMKLAKYVQPRGR